MSLAQSDHVRAVLDRLDLEASIIAECRMKDALEQHAPLQEEYIPDERDWQEYSAWSRWLERVELPND